MSPPALWLNACSCPIIHCKLEMLSIPRSNDSSPRGSNMFQFILDKLEITYWDLVKTKKDSATASSVSEKTEYSGPRALLAIAFSV